MAKKEAAPEPLYNVVRGQDGALVVIAVDISTAQSECARLNVEAKLQLKITAPDMYHAEPDRPTGMFHGELVVYEVRSRDGLAVAS